MVLPILVQKLTVDPFLVDYELNLFGSTIDNLVVIGDSEFLLDVDVIDDTPL